MIGYFLATPDSIMCSFLPFYIYIAVYSVTVTSNCSNFKNIYFLFYRFMCQHLLIKIETKHLVLTISSHVWERYVRVIFSASIWKKCLTQPEPVSTGCEVSWSEISRNYIKSHQDNTHTNMITQRHGTTDTKESDKRMDKWDRERNANRTEMCDWFK